MHIVKRSFVIGAVFLICFLFIGLYLGLRDNGQGIDKTLFNNTPKYQISGPAIGNFIQTKTVSAVIKDDIATVRLNKDEAKNTAIYQNVILYNNQKIIHPLGGKVTEKIESDDSTILTIRLPNDINKADIAKDMDIITLDMSGAKQIPLSALLKDKNDRQFIWMVEETNGNTSIRRQYMEILFEREGVFVPKGVNIKAKDVIIINPDKNLQSDKKYQFQDIVLTSPSVNPIQLSRMQHRQERLKKQSEQNKQLAIDCKNGIRSGSQSGADNTISANLDISAESCGSATQIDDALELFRNLQNNGAE